MKKLAVIVGLVSATYGGLGIVYSGGAIAWLSLLMAWVPFAAGNGLLIYCIVHSKGSPLSRWAEAVMWLLMFWFVGVVVMIYNAIFSIH